MSARTGAGTSHGKMAGNRGAFDGEFRDAGEHEQDHPKRRMQKPDHRIERQDQAEMDRIDAEFQDDRKEDRHQDRDSRDGVDEAADEQDQQIRQEQEDPLILRSSQGSGLRKDLGGLARR